MYLGEIAGLGTTFFWAISTLTFEAAGRRIGSVPMNFIRLVMALGMLTIWGVLSSRHLPLPTDAECEQWLWLSLSGLVGFFLGDLCLFRAFVMIGPRLTMLVFTLAPPLTATLGWAVLGETLTWWQWAGMALTLCGVVWVVAEGKVQAQRVSVWKASAWGVALAFLGALGQAGGNVLGKKGMMDYDPSAAVQIRVIAALPAFALLFLAMRWYPRVVRGLADARAMSLMALGALAGPVVGVSLLFLSMQLLPAAVSQTFVAALPVVIMPFTIIVYKEHVSRRAVLGALVAMAGVTVLFVTPKQIEWLGALLP